MRSFLQNRIFHSIIIIFIALSFGACSNNESEEITDSTINGCLGSSEEAIIDLDCQEITIAVENAYFPFNYLDLESGEPTGWDYAAWDAICERLHCTPIYVEAAWDGLIQAVADGQFDVGADGITNTVERQDIVSFSDGYISIEQRLLVIRDENRFSSIDDFLDDGSLILGTQAGTTNYETAVSILPEEQISAFEQFPFAIQALMIGDVDAVLIDENAGQGYLGENAEQLELIGPSLSSDELAFIFSLDSDLVETINQALDDMRNDGSLETINNYYFGGQAVNPDSE